MQAKAIEDGALIKIWCSGERRNGARCERTTMLPYSTEDGAGPWWCDEHILEHEVRP